VGGKEKACTSRAHEGNDAHPPPLSIDMLCWSPLCYSRFYSLVLCFLRKQGIHSRQCRRVPWDSVSMVCRARISGRNADPTTSRAREVPCTQKQVSSSYVLCGNIACLCGNYACNVLHSERKRVKEHINRTSRARVMLDCLQTDRHPHDHKRLGGSSSVTEGFGQVPLRFSAQVGCEESDSEVRS